MLPDNPLKRLFRNVWDRILATHGEQMRPVVIESVEKMLWCATSVYGSKYYTCENPHCTHSKYLHYSCKSRACSSCGTKSTELWVAKQRHILPHCTWQHITFTLPDVFWPIFKHNRALLNALFRLAANVLLGWAAQKELDIGIFCAMHTYGRQFNWNVHLHLSVTRGGICRKTGKWKSIYFKGNTITACWKAAVIEFFRKQHGKLILPSEYHHPLDWFNFLDGQYQRYWHVHLAKETKKASHTIGYLGRYLKKLPLSASRLRHISANEKINIRYLDHRSGRYDTLSIDQEALVLRLIDHIPEKHFRMIRYYGFLATRKRTALLPKVYAALEQEVIKINMPAYAAMLKGFVKVDPFKCILCGGRMVYSTFRAACSISALINARMSLVKTGSI